MTDVALKVLPNRMRKSRNSRRRAIVLGVVQLAIVIHVGHWLNAGRTVSPVEPSESMELVKRGVINAGAIFFILALLSTVVLGRWFCGWGCHMVMLQDLCGWLMRRVGVRPKPFRSRLLLWVPFAFALYMFVWPVVARLGVIPLSQHLHRIADWIPELRAAPPWHGFTVEVTTADFWATFAGPIVAVPFVLVCGVAMVYFLGMKGLCNYGCPYGGFFAPLDEFAPARIRVTDACEHCGHCTATCSSNVRVHEEVAAYGMVVNPGCLKCLDCVSVCPNDALYFGFGRPAARKGEPKRSYRPQRWDMTLPEECAAVVVFLVSFFAYRGLYGLVPMLMAISMAMITTFLAYKTWKACRGNASFHRWRLRFHGHMTRAGVAFLVLTGALFLLTAHAGAVQGAMALARLSDGRVTVPRAAVFGASPMELPEPMQRDARRAIARYAFASSIRDGGIGFTGTPENVTRRAWLHACLHEFEAAEALLRLRMLRYGVDEMGARDVTALLAIQLRDDDALEYAAGVLDDHPDFVGLLDETAMQMLAQDRRAEALALCERSLAKLEAGDPRRLQVMRRISLILLDMGRLDDAIELIQETILIDDTNPAAFEVLADALEMTGRVTEAAEARRRAAAIGNRP